MYAIKQEPKKENERIKKIWPKLLDVDGWTFLNLRATRYAPHKMEKINRRLLTNLKKN